MEIHPKARKLLRKLVEKGGQVSEKDLVGMDHAEIMRPARWLEEKGLVEIKEKTTEKYELTDKGEDAFEKGLPEEILLKKLEEDGKMALGELKNVVEAFSIAIGQGKKNGWIDIDSEKKKVSITDKGKKKLENKFKENNILRQVKEDETPSEDDLIEKLIERGLVRKEKETEMRFKVTKKGKKIDKEKEPGKEKIGQLKPEHIRTGEWKERGLREYGITDETSVKTPGKKQPYRQYLDQVRKKLLAMGFMEANTSYIETEFWNFDVLFQAQDHPAREIHDKFELKNPEYGDLMEDEVVKRVKEMHEKGGSIDSKGWNYKWSRKKASKLMLRSQTTATSVRYLARDLPSPAKVFAIDRNFRYDEIDKTHFVEFYQAEGIVKAPDLSLKNLFGYLEIFGKEIAGAEKIRFRPNYFPFTEPSVELDAYHPEIGWVEMGGAGLFRPEVRNPLGVKDPVIAWGMGIDRLAMFKLGKDDIRELVFPQNLEELRKTPAVRMR